MTTEKPSTTERSQLPAELLNAFGYNLAINELDKLFESNKYISAIVNEYIYELEDRPFNPPFNEILRAYAKPEDYDHELYQEILSLEESSASCINAVEKSLNVIEKCPLGSLTWTYLDSEGATTRARQLDSSSAVSPGKLHGVTIGIKDIFERSGWRATWGSPLRANATVARATAPILRVLEEDNAIILGTQHMAEFAMSPTGLNQHTGPGRNPKNHECISGGSSSGAGMSVGAGHVQVAIGTDTGGSIRIPAAYCGAYGLKPTQGLINDQGSMPLAPSLDCIGPVAESLQLCARTFEVIRGATNEGKSPCLYPEAGRTVTSHGRYRFKVVVPDLGASRFISDVGRQRFEQGVNDMIESGIDCSRIELPDLGTLNTLSTILFATESAAFHRSRLRTNPEMLGDQVRRRLARGLLMNATDYLDALRLRGVFLKKFMGDFMGDAHAMLLPSVPDTAPFISDTIGKDQQKLEEHWSAISYWVRGINYLGLPAVSIPVQPNEYGMPLSLQLVGRPYGERAILSIAHKMERLSISN